MKAQKPGKKIASLMHFIFYVKTLLIALFLIFYRILLYFKVKSFALRKGTNQHLDKNPYQIYDFLNKIIFDILLNLSQSSKNTTLQTSRRKVLKVILKFKNQILDSAILELKKKYRMEKISNCFLWRNKFRKIDISGSAKNIF